MGIQDAKDDGTFEPDSRGHVEGLYITNQLYHGIPDFTMGPWHLTSFNFLGEFNAT